MGKKTGQRKGSEVAPKAPVPAPAPAAANPSRFRVVATSEYVGRVLLKQKKSKYADLIEACAKLEHGRSIVYPLVQTGKVDLETQRNRISASIKRRVKEAGAKGRLRFAVTKDGELLISCVPA